MTNDLEITARALVADGKGILAADETPGTLTKRFAALGIDSTPDSRRTYREMFFEHLNAINRIEGIQPWKLSFSCGRALQDEALTAWQGRDDQLTAGQRAFHHRAKCDSAAALGRYGTSMEQESVVA